MAHLVFHFFDFYWTESVKTPKKKGSFLLNLDKTGPALWGPGAPPEWVCGSPPPPSRLPLWGSWLRQSRRRRDFPLRGLPVRRHEKSTNGLQLVLSPVICSSVQGAVRPPPGDASRLCRVHGAGFAGWPGFVLDCGCGVLDAPNLRKR